MFGRVTRRRVFLSGALVALLKQPTQEALAASFPARPITLVVPFPAGGPTDREGRLLAELLSEDLLQRVVVENRPGAGGVLGLATAVRSARPDGYTIGLCSTNLLRAPIIRKLDWHPLTEFTFISAVSRALSTRYALLVSGHSPYKSIHDYLIAARARPGKLTYGTVGVGSANHMLVELFAQSAGVELVHVAFKGSSDMLPALIGGHIDAASDAGGWDALARRGDIRPVMLFSDQISRRWPTVPSALSLGHDVVGSGQVGIVGPKGVDGLVVRVLQESVRRVVSHPRYLDMMEQLDQEPDFRDSAGFLEWARAQYEQERRIVAKLGLAAQ